MSFLKKIFSRILADLRACRIALLIIICYLVLTQSIFHTVCPMAILTGIPCPGCGLTRSGLWVLTGHLAEAWNLNPTIYLWLPLILYGILFRYLLGRKPPYYLLFAALVSGATCIWYVWSALHGYMVPLPYKGILRPFLQSLGIFA